MEASSLWWKAEGQWLRNEARSGGLRPLVEASGIFSGHAPSHQLLPPVHMYPPSNAHSMCPLLMLMFFLSFLLYVEDDIYHEGLQVLSRETDLVYIQ